MTKKLVPVLCLPILIAANAEEVARVPDANLQRPVWDPTGTQLAYEANFHERKEIELYVGDFAKKRFQRVTPLQTGTSSLTQGFDVKTSGSVAHELSWSPAAIGRYVYSASNQGQDYDLFVAGGGAIWGAPGADGNASWSPDGQHIVFTSARSGQGDLYLIDVYAIENEPRQLTDAPETAELDASWSSDGKKLAFVGHTDTGDNLSLIDGLQSAPVPLVTWPGSQTRPTFSPNRDLIAFYANKEERTRWDLYTVDAAKGAVPRQMATDVVPNAEGPTFTPDGSHLVFVKNDDTTFDPLVAVRVDDPESAAFIELGTVGHGDLDITTRDGIPYIAYVAQGQIGGEKRDYKRIFAAPLPPLP